MAEYQERMSNAEGGSPYDEDVKNIYRTTGMNKTNASKMRQTG